MQQDGLIYLIGYVYGEEDGKVDSNSTFRTGESKSAS